MALFIQQNHERTWTRSEYSTLRRHPVRIVSWNAKDVNTAGIIRTAEAFRLELVTFLRKPKTMAAGVGTQYWQPWQTQLDLVAVINEAKADGYTIVALEQTDGSIPLPKAELPTHMCLVAGDEGVGVPPKALALADMAVVIPQYGMVGSLNVTTAVSIALYEWCRQHGEKA